MSIYDIEVKTIDGKTITLEKYKGEVMLIVNVASKCGFTPQYKGLEDLYAKYHERGFRILGFPCNQFLSQEPGSNQEIAKFCSLTYGVTFDMFAKIDVNGDTAHPLYQYLKAQEPGFMGTEFIKWNFTKFLVDRQGNVIKRYAPSTEPKEIEKDIEKLL
ncbi:glutathione peroxidase [Sulfurospirillum sp. 1612]|uniref:glutathione peroxidase n=1 Tax=Sulfurospirillum sp. 1612 TaxID=3094835 RepID=UPI002F950FA6